jgi:NodT family efflux transporter outer membrane factor (OMF) lipoprotein
MSAYRITSRLCGLAVLLWPAACAVGPDFVQPAAPVGTYGAPTHFSQADGVAQSRVSSVVDSRWWTAFGSRKLSALVDQSLANSPTITAADAALRQSRELYSAQWAAFLPSVTAGFNQTRSKDASGAVANPAILPNGNPPDSTYSLYTSQVAISYGPDIFGANQRASESALANVNAARFQLDAARAALVGNVVVTCIQYAALREQIALTESMIARQQQLTRIVEQQNTKIGTASALDVLQQKSNEAAMRAGLAPLRKQADQAHDALAALLGVMPDANLELPGLDEVHLPENLPVSLPSEFVRHRPDVRLAEENLHAATAQVGVALAAMLPNVTLTGSMGTSARVIEQSFTPYYGFWNFGTNLSQIVFDGGGLLHRRRAADAAMDQAASLYRATVLTAFQNAADSLKALESDALAAGAAQAADRAAQDSLSIAGNQIKIGSISQVQLLTNEISADQARLSLLQARAARLSDTAALFQAMGGDLDQTQQMTQAQAQ